MNRTMRWLRVITVMILSGHAVVEAAAIEAHTVYAGVALDDRITGCGIIVFDAQDVRIMPFLDGRGDVDGRLLLEVAQQGTAAPNRSRQARNFTRGQIGTTIVSMPGPAALEVVLSISDRSGQTMCEMRQTIVVGSIALKI